MKFSVVIPTYNREATLAVCLESVFAQTCDDYEVIVVDDGSTDDTQRLLAKYEAEHQTRLRVLRQQNQGPGAARNRGVAAARGEYVAFLDSDDRWLPWSLQVYAAMIDAYGRPAFLTGKQRRFTEDATLGPVERAPLQCEAFADYYASCDRWRWFGVSSFVVRQDALEQVGGFADEPMNAEDADLAMRLGTMPGFVHICAPVTFAYRQHQGNLTAEFDRGLRGIQHLINSERSGKYPGGERRRVQRSEILARHARPVALNCLRRGAPAEAWRLYRQTLTWHLAGRRWKFLVGFPVLASLPRCFPNRWAPPATATASR